MTAMGPDRAMIDQELLDILVCPETKQPVQLADDALIAQLNGAIDDGTLVNQVGETVAAPIEGGLLREDGQVLYAIRDEIPIMLIDEAIVLSQLS